MVSLTQAKRSLARRTRLVPGYGTPIPFPNRVPWRLQDLYSRSVSSLHYHASRFHHRPSAAGRPRLLLRIPPYGFTGASAAQVAVLNLLAETCDCTFLAKPSNVMNRYVARGIRISASLPEQIDVALIESGEDPALVAELRKRGARIVVTMHGDPPAINGMRNHGYSDQQILGGLALADSVQYISDTQQPLLDRASCDHAQRIPNVITQTPKGVWGSQAVGIVGDMTLARKNFGGNIEAATRSAATAIHCWGKHPAEPVEERIRRHGFVANKAQIFDSFDVLVHLAWLEAQPLAVWEAISAGIPCVLAEIPNYDALRGLDGIRLVDPHDADAAAAAIDATLAEPARPREALVAHWQAHNAPDVIRQQWLDYLDEVLQLPAPAACG